MEEVKINENEIVEEEDVCEAQEDSGSGILGKIVIGLGVAAAAGIGALVYKNRDKIEARRIARLEKKGYVITKPEADDEDLESKDLAD